MRLIGLVVILALSLILAPLAAEAQPAGKIARIGILRAGSPPDPYVEAFRQGLRELGYVEGRNISIEYRWTDGKDERLPGLAADLVRLKVDVIVASASAALAAKHATTAIPIVMPVTTDPIGAGLVASLARPGGNVTGLATLTEEMAGKWLELVREALPRVSRVAALWDPATSAGQLRASEVAARSLGVRLQTLTVRRPDDFGTAFVEAQKHRAEALIVLGSPFFFAHRTRIVELAAQHRLPTMYQARDYVVGSGGLMSYGADFHDLFRRAAGYVDKILKGAKPADLPVEQPTKFELVINLRTAKTLGLTIPRSLLARADQVIK
jgi:putative ABC transport system substrate-binding protein